MSLPLIESAWVKHIEGFSPNVSTRVVYPVEAGTVRVTLISGTEIAKTLYQGSILVELWANPATSDTDAVSLHSWVLTADSNPAVTAQFAGVNAAVPLQHDDPDSDLDRYQFTVSFYVRTV